MSFINKNSINSSQIWKAEQHLSKIIAESIILTERSGTRHVKWNHIKTFIVMWIKKRLHCKMKFLFYILTLHYWSSAVWSVKQTDPWPDLTVTLLLWAPAGFMHFIWYQPRRWIHIPPHSHLPILLSHVIQSPDRMNNSWKRLNQIVLTNNFFVELCVRHLKRFQKWIFWCSFPTRTDS